MILLVHFSTLFWLTAGSYIAGVATPFALLAIGKAFSK